MLDLQPEQSVFSIVLTGEFNPAIIHPTWFVAHDLMAAEEVGDVSDLLCSSEVAVFTADEVHVQAERQRFGLTTKDASQSPKIRDLAIGIFRLLEHTPINALGLNLNFRFALDSESDWHAVGHALVPKSPWVGILNDAGTLAVTVRGSRPGCVADHLDLRVQPIWDPAHGVFVAVNQHYNIRTDSRQSIRERHQQVAHVLEKDWVPFQAFALQSAKRLLEDAIQSSRTS